MEGGGEKLGSIVRRDRGGHADRNARRAVGQDVGKGAGQYDRLLVLLVVGGPEIDGILGDACQQLGRHLGHARLGVAHGGRVIAVDVAEIALAVDQGIADGEILGEPHQRIVDGLVAMRVELAHHLADDAGAFGEALVGVEAKEPHGMHDAAMDRLQPVPHVGQRPVHDGRQRIGEIALLERLPQVDRFDMIAAVGRRRCKPFSHGLGLADTAFAARGRPDEADRSRSGASIHRTVILSSEWQLPFRPKFDQSHRVSIPVPPPGRRMTNGFSASHLRTIP